MRMETETPVTEVLRWLAKGAPADARELLVGCSLDDGDSEDVTPIVGFDVDRTVVELRGGRRVPLAAVRNGVIVETRLGAPLASAVASAITPQERQEREESAELGRAGIVAEKLASPADRRAALTLLRSIERSELPDRQKRDGFYIAVRAGDDPGLARVGARVFRLLLSRFAAAGRIPDDLHWRLARCLRSSGQLREAVAVSEVLHTGSVKEPEARKFLATTRAAALLDLYEATHDTSLFALAERVAKVAYALGPADEEIKSVYRRLDALRAAAGCRGLRRRGP